MHTDMRTCDISHRRHPTLTVAAAASAVSAVCQQERHSLRALALIACKTRSYKPSRFSDVPKRLAAVFAVYLEYVEALYQRSINSKDLYDLQHYQRSLRAHTN
jgi:hypothetical protein